MEIISSNIYDTQVLKLFSEHDDFMIDFLGADKVYYTRYSEKENIEAVWIVYSENLPIGCIAYRKKENGVGEIKRMFIKDRYRGQENHAKNQNCHTLFLDTRITLEPAVSLYRNFGFAITFQQGLYVQMEKKI